MAAIELTVFSDYVCPWCFIGLTELSKLDGEFELKVDWRPFLLRPDAPDEGWALPAHIKARMNSPDNPLTQRAKALGVTLVEREHIPSSRRAHECTEFARAHGKLDAFHHGVLERYWSKGEDLSDWAVLRAAAVDAGLDADAMQAEVSAGKWKPVVQESLGEASELGVSAVPTFIVGNKFVIQGAQDAAVFRQAFGRLNSKV
jgi:predicted DsbA family dithiol-disulfide isomerase